MEQTILSTHQQMVDYLVSGQADFYRLAFSYVKNRDAALDVVQESIVKALSKSDTLRETAYLKTWFYRILLNESMNYFRRNQRLLSWRTPSGDRGTRGPGPGGAAGPPRRHRGPQRR